MVQMNLFTKQKQSHRCRKQTYGYQWEIRGGINWEIGIDMYTVCVCTQSCLTLCNPMDCSLPGSSVHGIFQARILEWIAISSSRVSSQPRDPALHLLHWQADYHWATWEAPGDPLSNGEKDFLRKGFSRGQEKGPNGVKIFLWRKEGRIPGKWN